MRRLMDDCGVHPTGAQAYQVSDVEEAGRLDGRSSTAAAEGRGHGEMGEARARAHGVQAELHRHQPASAGKGGLPTSAGKPGKATQLAQRGRSQGPQRPGAPPKMTRMPPVAEMMGRLGLARGLIAWRRYGVIRAALLELAGRWDRKLEGVRRTCKEIIEQLQQSAREMEARAHASHEAHEAAKVRPCLCARRARSAWPLPRPRCHHGSPRSHRSAWPLPRPLPAVATWPTPPCCAPTLSPPSR